MNKEDQARAIARIAELRLQGVSLDEIYIRASKSSPRRCDWGVNLVLAKLGYDMRSKAENYVDALMHCALKWAVHGGIIDFLSELLEIGYTRDEMRNYAEECKELKSTRADETIAWLDSLEDK